MSLISRVTTWVSNQILKATDLNGEFNNIVNTMNNLDSGTTKWDQVSILNASSVPLTADNSTGNQDIADFKANGSIQVSILSSGGLSMNAGLFPHTRVITAAGAVTVTSTDMVVIVNKASGAATTVNLTNPVVTAQLLVITDGKGDAAANNITITPSGGGLINGAATYVITTNYGSAMIIYNGTQWNVLSKF